MSFQGERFPAPRQQENAGYQPQRPGGLAANMQNLNINRPPPPFAQTQAPSPMNMAGPGQGQYQAPPAQGPFNMSNAASRPGAPAPAPIQSRPPPPGVMAMPGFPGPTSSNVATRPGPPPPGIATRPATPASSIAMRPSPPPPGLQPRSAPPSARPSPIPPPVSGPLPSTRPGPMRPTHTPATPFSTSAPRLAPIGDQGRSMQLQPPAPFRPPGTLQPSNTQGGLESTVTHAEFNNGSAIYNQGAPFNRPPFPPMQTTGLAHAGGFNMRAPFPGTQQPPPHFPGNARPSLGQTPGMHGMPPVQPPYGPGLVQPGLLPPPRMMGIPQPGSPATGMQAATRIDPQQIPRPQSNTSPLVFETRDSNESNPPPSALTDFIAKDTGNCSPRYMRCTLSQIPCSGDLLSASGMPLALMVQPFALPHPSEEDIQLVDFGESGPVRCTRCKAYINPFMRFIEQGKRFICNLCGCQNETPRDYFCNLGPDGKRRDVDNRPELCRGTVEFVATKEYMVRPPMPAVFFFLIDVSMNAIQTGATAAACNAISQTLQDLNETPRVMVGAATFDSTIHFYCLNRASQQPSMLVVPDVQDVYTPLETGLIVPLGECRPVLEQLLENIPTMFKENKVPESAFCAAIKGAFLAMKFTGGKLLVFQSVLPSVGIGALSARETEGRVMTSAGEKEINKLFQPADKIYKTMAIEFAEFQVCVDLFLTTQTYVDIASISTIPKTTGGQVYYYHQFSVVADSAKLYNDLRWNVSRPQGFEAVMRVRCSQGLQVQDYFGNFCKRIPTDVDLAAIDCDKMIMVTFKHDDKFQEGSECCFQCAILYTTLHGERRIRVTTLSLPCTSVLGSLFRCADLDAQFTYYLKHAANQIPNTPLVQLREQITNFCVNILHTYRKFCATKSSAGQLILPEALKLLPLYTLALTKSIGLRADVRVDERSYWLSRAVILSTSLAIPLVYPRLYAIHSTSLKDDEDSALPPTLPLSSENINQDGVYLLENGEDALIYAGKTVDGDILQKLFGVHSLDDISDQFILQQFDNDLSKKFNNMINEIRRQRCSYLRLRVCKRGDPTDFLFFSYMVEDKNALGTSYVDYLVHIHRQIQNKMDK